MNVGIICDNRAWSDPGEVHRHLAAGLTTLGHAVQVAAPGPGRPFGRRPEVAFLWNGVRGPWAAARRQVRDAGVATVIMERGFFDRFGHTQFDPAGFNHTASWAAELAGPAPPDGAARFVRAFGRLPRPMRPRGGYALVLLQVPGDAQLRRAEVRLPGPLVSAVEAAAPAGLDVRVRAHPLSRWSCGRRTIGGTLEQAVAGAKFCITINSNAGNEAMAMGAPVLCLGPALYATAAVALQTSLAELPRAIARMQAGWRPADRAVRKYLAHLACRQWSNEELADGRPLKRILDAAAGWDHRVRARHRT